ncbi:MAG: endonuclease domain-containing protein [Allosphingosinicella sp.]|uniref:endonuclease domain-containing protein n=1 Tax=Allosphingosinicella sp. TaxID=2823234 RepID=UPI003953C09F
MREDSLTFARSLRNNATPEERALWHVLSRIRPRWTRQLPLGPYVADFACRRARVIVELDGSQHVDSKSDERRASALEADGWRVLRFWNGQVHENLDGVIEAIIAAAEQRLPEGEYFEAIPHRAERERRPRTRK